MEALKKLFSGKSDTIDSVVADFNNKIARLRAVASKHNQDAHDKQEQARSLNEEANSHLSEVVRATKIADKINSLLEE